MELKILITIPILLWMCWQDWKKREINNISWVSLVVIGVGFFISDIIKQPSQILAILFAFSLFSGMLLGFSFYALEWLGGGDALAIIGLATVTYNMLPLPFIFVVLLPTAILGLSYGLLQGYFKKEVNVPYMIPILVGFCLACVVF